MYSYVVTSHKPTAVNHSLICNFTGPDERNLVVARGNYLEISTLRDDGLTTELPEVSLFGRIASLGHCRIATLNQDVLFVLTERKHFCVLSYDIPTQKIVTRAAGNAKDKSGRDLETGIFAVVDPDNRMVAMALSEGQMKVLPIDASGFRRDLFDVRLDMIKYIDIKFLHGCPRPTICVLHEESRKSRSLTTYEIDPREKELRPGPWNQKYLDIGAKFLIPVQTPCGGVIVVGRGSITYYNGGASQPQTVVMSETNMCAYGQIDKDGARYLLGDNKGMLYVLVLRMHERVVTSIMLDTIGITSIPQTLNYLDNGLVFVGSIFSDSQIIRLRETPDDATGSHIELLETRSNIGPILDMCVVETEKQGQSQLVTCTGYSKDGSLRVVRCGIGIQEQASIEIPGIKGIWSLKRASDGVYDDFLVQSFIGETRVMAIENEEMSEVEIPGFDDKEATVYCGNVAGDLLVQVTPLAARIVHSGADTGDAVTAEYVATNTVTVAGGHGCQLVLALTGGELVYLVVDPSTGLLLPVASAQQDQDVACISLRPIVAVGAATKPGNVGAAAGGVMADSMAVESDSTSDCAAPVCSLVAVGMWTDNSVRLLALPTLQELCRVSLGVDTQARDLLLVTLEDTTYLLVGLGDGTLITFVVEMSSGLPSLVSRKKVALGTRPISLTCFAGASSSAVNVFASCDRPTIIYSRNGKILFSVVNIGEVTGMASFHSAMFPHCLALHSEEGFSIGTVDDIQRVHVRTVPLGESPRRITYNSQAGVYAVCTEAVEEAADGNECTRCKVLIIEEGTMERVQELPLEDLEQVLSCCSCYLGSADVAATKSGAGGGSGGDGSRAMEGDGDESLTVSGGGGGGEAGEGGRVTRKEALTATEYIVVGTAFLIATESEPSRGRLLVYEVAGAGADRVVRLVAEKDTKGAVFGIAQLPGGRIVANIGSKTEVFHWVSPSFSSSSSSSTSSSSSSSSSSGAALGGYSSSFSPMDPPELRIECSHSGSIVALCLRTHGEFVLVGDIMRSMTLLQYRPSAAGGDGTLEEIARDYAANSMRGVEIVGESDDVFLGADESGNLFTVKRNADAATDEERGKLEPLGDFGLGEYINVIRRGTLNSQPVDADQVGAGGLDGAGAGAGLIGSALSGGSAIGAFAGQSMLFGTVSGTIGTIIPLNEDGYRFYSALERAVKAIKGQGVGNLSHDDFRAFNNDRRTSAQRNFVDGDLVEKFLDLDRPDLEAVARQLNDELEAHSALQQRSAGGLGGASGGSHSSAGTNSMSIFTQPDRTELSVEEIVRRVEEIARMH